MINRVQRILLQLIHASGPLTSADIAQALGVSRRTAVSDMSRVAAVLQNGGARLISRRNWGYAVSVVNEAQFRELVRDLDMHAMQIEVAGYDETARFLYVARRLIAANGVLLDDIAEELSVSRSSLRSALRRAYAFLESYGLSVCSAPGHGMKVEGQEHLLRLAMTELFVAHFHQAQLCGVDAGYARIIACDWQERQDIRHAYLEVQRQGGWSVRDSRTQRIAMFVIIARNRARDGHRVILPQEDLQRAQESELFVVAQRVIATLSERFEGFDKLDEHDCALLTLYMLANLVPNTHRSMRRVVPSLITMFDMHLRAVIADVCTWLGCDVLDTPEAQEQIWAVMLACFVQDRLGLRAPETFDHKNEQAILMSPVCMAAAQQMAALIERRIGVRVAPYQRMVLANTLLGSLAQTAYACTPLRILVCDGMGIEMARQKGELIKELVPQFVASIHPCELYEIRGYSEDDYDFALIDAQDVSYNYTYPCAHQQFVSGTAGLGAVCDRIAAHAYHIDDVLFPKERMVVQTMKKPSSLAHLLENLGVEKAHLAHVAHAYENTPGWHMRKSPLIVHMVDTPSEERMVIVRFEGALRASSWHAECVAYIAVSGKRGKRHLKAVERLAYLMARDGFEDLSVDPAEGSYQKLRSSMHVCG